MKSATFRTDSADETIELGRTLSCQLAGVVLLIGNLGAGKTTLAKGIVEGLGIAHQDEVSSPTFTLIHQYGGQCDDHATRPVFHIDLYRLDEESEVETLGLRDLFAGQSLILLEWAERFPALLPAVRTEIRITVLNDETRNYETRDIVVTSLP